MCGRFTQRYTWREVHDLYGLTGAARNLQARYDIAPTETVEVVMKHGGGGATELVPMRWGLIPYWWKKPPKQLPATFNARAESVADKPMFRDAFKRQESKISFFSERQSETMATLTGGLLLLGFGIELVRC